MTPKQFNDIVDEYSNRLCRFADKLLVNKEQAKDLVQDAFAKLWENRELVVLTTVKSWLFTVVYHMCINHLKQQNRVVYDYEFDLSLHSYQQSSDLKEVLQSSLDMLTDVQKSILLLRDYEGYTYEEIGQILNLKESQVKVYLFRARQKMKDYLKDIDLVI